MDLKKRCRLLGEIFPNKISCRIINEILDKIVDEDLGIESKEEKFNIALKEFVNGFQNSR